MAGLHNWGTIDVERRRTVDYQFAMYETDGTTAVALEATDVIRFKVFNEDGTVILDLDSVAASSNNSSVTIDNTTGPARATVRMAQNDTALLTSDRYKAELLLVDDSEIAPVDAIKCLAYGSLIIYGSASGDVGKT